MFSSQSGMALIRSLLATTLLLVMATSIRGEDTSFRELARRKKRRRPKPTWKPTPYPTSRPTPLVTTLKPTPPPTTPKPTPPPTTPKPTPPTPQPTVPTSSRPTPTPTTFRPTTPDMCVEDCKNFVSTCCPRTCRLECCPGEHYNLACCTNHTTRIEQKCPETHSPTRSPTRKPTNGPTWPVTWPSASSGKGKGGKGKGGSSSSSCPKVCTWPTGGSGRRAKARHSFLRHLEAGDEYVDDNQMRRRPNETGPEDRSDFSLRDLGRKDKKQKGSKSSKGSKSGSKPDWCDVFGICECSPYDKDELCEVYAELYVDADGDGIENDCPPEEVLDKVCPRDPRTPCNMTDTLEFCEYFVGDDPGCGGSGPDWP